MKLLLTGASGFIGRNLILGAPGDWQIVALYHRSTDFPEFVAQTKNPNVRAVQCDLASREDCARLFREHGRDWDACLHLAAKVDIPWSVREPAQDLYTNVGPLLNLLDGTRFGRFVHFSSGAVYDGQKGEVHPDTPVSPTLPYAISKLTAERYVQFYAERQKTIGKFLIIRFFGAYGPYEAPHKIYTRLIKSLAIEGKNSYTIYGDGTNLIDAMYVDDAIEALRRILSGGYWNTTANLAAGRPISIEQLVRETAETLGVGDVQIRKEGVANESNQFWGSTRELRDALGFEAGTSLATGVRKFRQFLSKGVV